MSANTCRYLTALLTEGSFSKAAQALDISQPSLSQFLLRLETLKVVESPHESSLEMSFPIKIP